MKHGPNKESGLSLVELLVVMAIIVIVSAIAVSRLLSSRDYFSRQNAVTDLKNAFERARFDSVKRRAANQNERAKVVIDRFSATLVTDNDGNGLTTDSADARIIDMALRNTATEHLNESASFPVTVAFDARGETIISGATTAVFRLCSGACTGSNNDPAHSTIVIVTPTGTVNVIPGGATVPAFAAPSPITQVPANSNIRNHVQVP